MSYVFLSFSSENRDNADQLKSLMEQNGIQVWMSSYNILPGQDFADAIPPAIENCGCFVLLLTPEVLASEWVRKELDSVFGCRPKKAVIPVQMEQVQLDAGMDFMLKNCQILTLPTFNQEEPAVQQFISQVKAALAGKWQIRALLKTKKKSPLLWISAFAAVAVLALVLAFSGLFSTPLSKDPYNEIPVEYVSELQTVVDDTSPLHNISIKVGERITPQAAKIWDCTIYSQDTRIAIGEGRQVAGVAAGTTYIVVVENNTQMAQAYRVTVTDDTTSTLGVNQIPEKHDSLVDALKHGNKSNVTVRLKAGETKSIPTTWSDVTVYSGDTGVVVSTGQGPILQGVSAGTAYVVVESSTGAAAAYFVEVSEP